VWCWAGHVSARVAEVSEEADDQNRPIDLDALFRHYARDLNGYALRRLKDREAAADLVQDGFIRCLTWQRSRTVPTSMSDARKVLWRIVGNLTIDFVRRKRVRHVPLPLDAALQIADPYPTQDRFIEGRQAYRLVKMVLDESPPQQRAALLLNRVGGLTHIEVAERLGVSPNTVCNYIVAMIDRCFVRLAPLID
jgi:RNA polymerase sigma factor (sigma-70 family)